MINGAELADGLKDRLLSYMTSALPVGNHESQRLLGQRFFEAWQQGLFKGPYFETIPPYERLKSLAQRFEEKSELTDDNLFAERFRPKYSWAEVDHKFPFARPVRDRIWTPGSHEADLENSTTTHQALWMKGLFKHQWDAFSRAIYKRENFVVSTGTGSGKTECFQLPILYRLLTEPQAIRARRGVRALLVYPLNALVEDQSTRLRRLLFWINLQFHEPRVQVASNQQITFGRYTGDTPVNASDFARRESDEALKGLGELVYREDMQAFPPDILITNFTMLEYMLLREDDRQLFANPDLFSFVVLDEIHTYSGTQGMEVAMLLRRLRGFLEGRSSNRLHIQCVGTSATLGGSDAKNEAAVFASTLFGSSFDSESIILGSRPATKPVKSEFSNWKGVLNLLSEEEEHDSIPTLLRGEELGSDSPFWNRLAEALGIPDPLIEKALPTSERLGALLVDSGLADQVRAMIESEVHSCIDLDSLAELISKNVKNSKVMTGMILSLLASSTHKHEPVLPLRTHLFINEAKSGQLCLYPKCQADPGGADAWWRRLYVTHHASCDECGSRVYSALLCRRCGFVYLEGWSSQFILWPERDSSERPENYERWLFRAASSELPGVTREIGGARTLCLECGRYFVGRDRETFATSQANHSCPQDRLLDIWVWRPEDLGGDKLESCLFCEQHWFPGEEVVTGPAPSTYAVSTLLLEELKRQFSASGSTSKIISFSDTRQQAAQLALRLQGTNRDFSFRQMVYQSVTEKGLSTDDLLDELFDFSKGYTKLRLVMAADPARPPGNAELREQLATLLYREAVTAYLTLEAQGLLQVQYDQALFEAARQIDIPSRILGRFSEEEKRHWLSFLLDWGMRFVRYALGAHKWGGHSVNYDELKEWNIYPKTAAIVGAQDQGIVGFIIRQRNRRNTVFNFASRVLRKGFGDVNDLDLAEFHAATRPFWNSVLACPNLWVKDAFTTTRPLLNSGGSDPERCLIQLNFSSLKWRRAPIDDPLFRCGHCGRLTFYSIRGVCPIRDCSGTLERISHREIEENQFSPIRHYRRLVTSAAITP